MSETKAVLSGDEFAELVDYIMKNLARTNQRVPRLNIIAALIDFEKKFDAAAMYRFKEWMKANGYDDDAIFSTIIHDLNDRNEPCFLPRTSGY